MRCFGFSWGGFFREVRELLFIGFIVILVPVLLGTVYYEVAMRVNRVDVEPVVVTPLRGF